MACQDLASAVLTLQLPSNLLSFLLVLPLFLQLCLYHLYLIEKYGMDLPYNNHCPGLLRKGFSHTPVPPDQWTCVDPALRAFSFSDSENIISRKHHMIYGFIWECLRDIPPYQEKKTDHVLSRPPELKAFDFCSVSISTSCCSVTRTFFSAKIFRECSARKVSKQNPERSRTSKHFFPVRHAGMQQSMDDF